MVSDYFNYDVDSLDYIISDLELDHSISDEWPLMSFSNPSCVTCLLYTSPSPRDATLSRMPSSA